LRWEATIAWGVIHKCGVVSGGAGMLLTIFGIQLFVTLNLTVVVIVHALLLGSPRGRRFCPRRNVGRVKASLYEILALGFGYQGLEFRRCERVDETRFGDDQKKDLGAG
jgi:hypothetical protein